MWASFEIDKYKESLYLIRKYYTKYKILARIHNLFLRSFFVSPSAQYQNSYLIVNITPKYHGSYYTIARYDRTSLGYVENGCIHPFSELNKVEGYYKDDTPDIIQSDILLVIVNDIYNNAVILVDSLCRPCMNYDVVWSCLIHTANPNELYVIDINNDHIKILRWTRNIMSSYEKHEYLKVLFTEYTHIMEYL
jgi:hypothetical protein